MQILAKEFGTCSEKSGHMVTLGCYMSQFSNAKLTTVWRIEWLEIEEYLLPGTS